jgi:hypothetical protein
MSSRGAWLLVHAALLTRTGHASTQGAAALVAGDAKLGAKVALVLGDGDAQLAKPVQVASDGGGLRVVSQPGDDLILGAELAC